MTDHPVSIARKRLNMSQAALARACGYNRSTVCRIEKGYRGSLETYRRLGQELGVDYRLLLPKEPASEC